MRRIILMSALILAVVPAAPAQYVPYQGFDNPRELVEHWYRTFLRRSPRGDASVEGWTDQLRRGAAPNSVLAGIMGSREYYAKGGSNPEGFIRNVYADVLVRPPREGEVHYWMRRAATQDFNDPQSRRDIAYEILTNNPGSSGGSYDTAPPPPDGYDRDREREWRRDWERRREREREREDYDYRRPYYPYRR